MQTFLPYPDFSESAKALDKKRCWKQVVEAKQIITILEAITNTPPQGVDKSIAWRNHPAVKMWVGHKELLKTYYNRFLRVCIDIHRINTTMKFFKVDVESEQHDVPWWLGDEDFHRAMRARLIQKDREFYLPKFPEDENYNDGVYLWPVMDGTKTFKII